MSYRRVIPRDLFNEANLLKCYGRLWILLDNMGPANHAAELDEGRGAPFDVQQDAASGALTIANLPFRVGKRTYYLTRPLNSRHEWPLYATDDDDEETEVFTDAGEFTPEFLALIGAKVTP